MIAIILITIILILALVALVAGGLMWDHQGRHDITAPDWREAPRHLRERATFTPDDTAEVLEHTQRRIELYQLAMHQLRLDQLDRERELIRRVHTSHFSHNSHP